MAKKLVNKADVISAKSEHAKKHDLCLQCSSKFFLARGHAIFQGGCIKYVVLSFKRVAYCRFRRVR